VTFGAGGTGSRLTFTLARSQSWLNNSANALAFNARSTVTMAGNTLTLGGSGDMSISATMQSTGSGAVTKEGAGVLTLTGTNTYTGPFTLNAGRVRLGGALGNLGAGTVVLNAGTLSGNNATTARTLANNFTLGGNVSLGHVTDSGLLTMAGAGTLTANRSVTVDSPVVISGAIGDGGGNYLLTKAGAGTLTLSGANSYGGGTQVDAGTLNLANLSAMPFSGTVSVGAGATIALAVDNGNPLTYWTTAEIDALWANSLFGFNLDSGALVGIDTSPGDVAYASSLGSTRGMVKIGTNTLTLSGASTFSGGVDVRNGTLAAGSDGALGTGTVTLRAGTALTNTVNSALDNAVTLAGNTAIGVASGTTMTISNAVDGSGGASLMKTGDGTLVFADTIALSGIFTNLSGTTILNGAGTNGFANELRLAVGAGSVSTFIQNDGFVDGSGGGGLLLGNVTGASGTYIMNGGSLLAHPTGANRGVMLGVNSGTTGRFELVDGTVTGKTLMITRSDAAGPQSVGYYIQSGGSAGFAGLTVAGGSAVNSSNSYALLAISNGTFWSSGFGGFASGNDSTGILYFGQGAQVTLPAFPTARGTNAYAEVTFDGGTLTPLAASTAYLTNATKVFLTDNGATLDVPTGRNITVGQSLEDASGDNGVLRKAGAGILTLAGANTYSGGTVVSNGTVILAVTAAKPGTGTMDVLAGGALGLRVGASFTTADVDTLWSGGMAGVTLDAASRIGIDTTEGDVTYGTAQSTHGLVKIGAGTLTLTGDNTYAGGTEIHNGALQIGNGGTSGALGTGDILSSGALVFNRSNAYTVPGAISGTGSLTNLGTGTLTLTNAVTLGGALHVRSGTVILSNATVNTTANVADQVGSIAGDSGILRIDGSTAYYRAQSSINLAQTGSSTGVVVMTGGTFTNGGTVQIGVAGVGSWIQTGGDILNSGEFRTTVQTSGSYGYYQMSGGTLTNGSWFQAARGGGWGLIYQDGGSIAVTANGLIVGNTTAGAAGTGVVYLTGGTLAAPAAFLTRAANARGELTVDGDAALTLTGNLVLNHTKGTNFVNLLGGVVTAAQVTRTTAGGLSGMIFDGGTLRAGAAGTLMAGGANAPDYVHILAGGATIDDNGLAVTVAPILGAPSGNGLTVLGLGAPSVTGYVGAPYVSIDGGGGTGATAVAQFDHITGSVTGLVITSPGFGYTSAPTVTLSGGGRDSFAVPTVTLGATSGGGLTKEGTGTLSLTADNTYTGGTWIKTGALQVGAGGTTGALGTGAVTNDAVLIVNRSNASTMAAPIVGAGSLTNIGAGTVSLTAVSPFNGGAAVRNGGITLSDGGRLTGASEILVQGPGTFTLDNTAVALGDRLPDAAPLKMRGGTFVFTHDAAASTSYSETLGALRFESGASRVAAARAADDLSTSTLTFSSLVREGNAQAMVEAPGLGEDARSQIFFTTAPTTSNGLLPTWLLLTNVSPGRIDLAAYDGTAGLHAPAYEADEANWTAATVNGRPSAAVTITADRYLNSLVLDDGMHIAGPANDRQLYFTNSGSAAVILQTGGFSSITNNGNAGVNLYFGANQGVFHTLGDLFIRRGGDNNQAMRGTNGFVKTGPGMLTLLTAGRAMDATAVNNMLGTFSLQEGTLELQHANSLGGTVLDLTGGRLVIRNDADLAFKAQDAVPTNTPIVVSQSSTIVVARATSAEGGRTHTLGNLTLAPDTTLTMLRENFTGNSGVALRFDNLTLGGNATFFVQSGTGTGDGQMTFTNLTDNGGGYNLAVDGSSVIRSEFRVLNTMTLGGNLTVGAGGAVVVHAADGFANVAGNIMVQNGAIVSSADFTRELGSAAGQVRFTGGGAMGFGARGTPATFAFTQGGATGLLAWGAANFEVSALTLNEDDAGAQLTLLNGIDLNSGAGTVTRQVNGYNMVAVVAGAVTNTGAGTANFTKAEGGELWLNGGAGWNGTTRITGGLLRMPTTDMLSPGFLDLNPGNTRAVLETTGVVTNSLGTGVGQVRLRGTASSTQNSYPGFSAYGGNLTIDIGGDGTGTGAELEWDSTNFDPEGPNLGNGGGLYLNSANANGTTWFMNAIDLKGMDFGTALPLRRFEVLGSTAVLAGNLRNSDGTYTAGLRKTGAGALVLLGANTYDGYTRIDNGTLVIGANGTSGTLGSGYVTNLAGGVLAFNRGNNYMVDNLIVGAGAVAQIGSGTLTLSANNSYTGPTVVSNGILRINGAHSGPGLITVAGGTLGGTGSVVGAMIVQSGAKLAPGASPGIFTANGDVTLDGGSTFEVELNGLAMGTEYDHLAMGTGTSLTLTNPTLLVQLGFSPAIDDTFQIVAGFLNLSGTFNGLPDDATFTTGGTEFRIDYNTSDITLTVVPEPASLGVLGLLAMAALLRRRAR
jgi:autotransporter-associated beta strand protein